MIEAVVLSAVLAVLGWLGVLSPLLAYGRVKMEYGHLHAWYVSEVDDHLLRDSDGNHWCSSRLPVTATFGGATFAV